MLTKVTIPEAITLYQRKPISRVKNNTKTTDCAKQAAKKTIFPFTFGNKKATINIPNTLP